ncbi:Uncharacterized protein Adt_29901 [Abeliophyllum distichum]|uniref:Zinc knuckle CX2CX4HX4C domain-containing protein n=1 Tax=Abeliophyllum distichum TaxID=126358 RepID=A0ABD1R9P6_9LAMI
MRRLRNLLRPSEARVCVEVNLEHKLPDRVWIERGESRSFWQPVVYEQLPHFCTKCRHMGHLIDKCRAGMPPLDVERAAQATKPVGAKASKPITVPKRTADPATKPVDVELPVTDEVPLVERIGKGKGKEINVETSIPTDTASSIQLGGHQQGHFRRNSSEDLVGLGERQESDGFTTVQRKKSSKGIDIPRPSTRDDSQSDRCFVT